MKDYIFRFMFEFYPYIALSVFIVGSWFRFERGQYGWRSGSSQLLRRRQLIIGSYLFHIGIIVIFIGHLFGLLIPASVYHALGISAPFKQYVAVIVGGLFGLICLAGLVILIHRRLTDSRIRKHSSVMDFAILFLLLIQLLLGLISIPYSLQHIDGSTMLLLMGWAQHIVTFRGGAASLIANVPWVFHAHLFLGMTLFLIFPFSRLVHIWSFPFTYPLRNYQIVRTRRNSN